MTAGASVQGHWGNFPAACGGKVRLFGVGLTRAR